MTDEGDATTLFEEYVAAGYFAATGEVDEHGRRLFIATAAGEAWALADTSEEES